MTIEIGIWRIDQEPKPVEYSRLDLESRLQDILCDDISIAAPSLMVIGREVRTSYGKRIDILAINPDGHLVVLELKRDKTPREVVAQTLEYGSWIRDLENDEIAQNLHPHRERPQTEQHHRSCYYCDRDVASFASLH